MNFVDVDVNVMGVTRRREGGHLLVPGEVKKWTIVCYSLCKQKTN